MNKRIKFTIIMSVVCACLLIGGVAHFYNNSPFDDITVGDFGSGLTRVEDFNDRTMNVVRSAYSDDYVIPYTIPTEEFNPEDFDGYDVEYIGDQVMVSKPFQSCRLIVQSRKRDFNTMGAIDHIKGYQKLHILQYENEEQTENAFNYFNTKKWVDFCIADTVFTATEDQTFTSWGGTVVKADEYQKYLDNYTVKRDVIVAVLDTGINAAHPDFKGRLAPGGRDYSMTTNGSNWITSVSDRNSHGTHVSGIIADLTESNVKILPIKVLGDDGNGMSVNIIAGMNYVAELGQSGEPIVAMNISIASLITGSTYQSNYNAFKQIIDRALSDNIITVTGTGNNYGYDMADLGVLPGNIETAVTVSAIASENPTALAAYSNYGDNVNLTAPGSLVLAANSAFADEGAFLYITKSGTSMAVPHVVAVIALWASDANANYSADEIWDMLMTNARELPGQTGWNNHFGWGCVNADIYGTGTDIIETTTDNETTTGGNSSNTNGDSGDSSVTNITEQPSIQPSTDVFSIAPSTYIPLAVLLLFVPTTIAVVRATNKRKESSR